MAHRGTLIWDFDGTLATRSFNWPGAFIQALNEVAPGHSVTLSEILIELNIKFPWHMPEDETVERVDTGVWWTRMETFLAGIFLRLGFPHQAAELASRVHALAVKPDDYVLLPDALGALIASQELGWNQVILSNHMPDLPKMATALGLDEYISCVFTSANLGFSKPHPMIFRKVLASLPNHDSVRMIGDSYEADIIGAMSVGIPAILVRTVSGIHSHEAADLLEAVKIFSRLP